LGASAVVSSAGCSVSEAVGEGSELAVALGVSEGEGLAVVELAALDVAAALRASALLSAVEKIPMTISATPAIANAAAAASVTLGLPEG